MSSILLVPLVTMKRKENTTCCLYSMEFWSGHDEVRYSQAFPSLSGERAKNEKIEAVKMGVEEVNAQDGETMGRGTPDCFK